MGVLGMGVLCMCVLGMCIRHVMCLCTIHLFLCEYPFLLKFHIMCIDERLASDCVVITQDTCLHVFCVSFLYVSCFCELKCQLLTLPTANRTDRDWFTNTILLDNWSRCSFSQAATAQNNPTRPYVRICLGTYFQVNSPSQQYDI